jgi:flagellar biosynthesis protein FliR
MTRDLLQTWLESLGPDLVAVALCSARLLPVALLCPLMGGQAAPTTVKLAWVLSLSLFLHLEAGVSLSAPVESSLQWVALTMKELAYGLSLGLVAALPFDAARMGGRFIDLFRGTSAEASLPVTGSRESATGEVLHQLLVGLVLTGGLMPLMLSAWVRGFGWVPLGVHVPGEPGVLRVVEFAGGALATGLAVGAPVAAAVMAVDCLLGMVSRAAPQVNLLEMGAPLRILAGGALLWLGLGLVCERLLAGFLQTEHALFQLAEMAR